MTALTAALETLVRSLATMMSSWSPNTELSAPGSLGSGTGVTTTVAHKKKSPHVSLKRSVATGYAATAAQLDP